ncbi:MAG: L,D-transpeptidase [Prevotella sp.]|nr:L,D-transpeptidase [Prevotella sp.]
MTTAFCLTSSAQSEQTVSIGLDRDEAFYQTPVGVNGLLIAEGAVPVNDMDEEVTVPALFEDEGDPDEANMCYVKVGKKVYHVSNTTDSRAVYRTTGVKPENCFIVISKQEFRLYIYERVGQDTLLVAHYPVCYARNYGNKQRRGDMKTPESTLKKPFTISQIQDASTWRHDFGDGRGNVKAYGNWFLRLVTPGHSGIGIHGSTNNESSIPGRDSEGCIRLRDADIIHLKENYARVKTRVIIKPLAQGKLPFEVKAEQRLGGQYQAPKPGYTLLPGAQFVRQ